MLVYKYLSVYKVTHMKIYSITCINKGVLQKRSTPRNSVVYYTLHSNGEIFTFHTF